MIKHAAIRIDNIVYVGHRHGDCYDAIVKCGVDTTQTADERVKQGFVTDEGEFLDRAEAADHAFECGQIESRQKSLMSEQLW